MGRPAKGSDGEKKFTCDHSGCEKEFKKASNLKRHIRTVHPDGPPKKRTARTLFSSTPIRPMDVQSVVSSNSSQSDTSEEGTSTCVHGHISPCLLCNDMCVLELSGAPRSSSDESSALQNCSNVTDVLPLTASRTPKKTKKPKNPSTFSPLRHAFIRKSTDKNGQFLPMNARQLRARDRFVWRHVLTLYGSVKGAAAGLCRLVFGKERSTFVSKKSVFDTSGFQRLASEYVNTNRHKLANTDENVKRSFVLFMSGRKCISHRTYKSMRKSDVHSGVGVPVASLQRVITLSRGLDVGDLSLIAKFKCKGTPAEKEVCPKLFGLSPAEFKQADSEIRTISRAESRVENHLKEVGVFFSLKEMVIKFLRTYHAIDVWRMQKGLEPLLNLCSSTCQVPSPDGIMKDVPCKVLVIRVSIDGFPMRRDQSHTVMCFSSPNLGPRCNSPNYNHLLFGGSLSEGSEEVMQYIRTFVEEAACLENEVLSFDGQPLKVKLGIVAADQAMANKLVGGQSNSAHHFSSYAQVSRDDYKIFDGKVGTDGSATFRALCYQERVQLANESEKEEKKIAGTRTRGGRLPDRASVHKRMLEWRKGNGNRQEGLPPLGNFSDHVYVCMLHLAINNAQHLFKEFYMFVCKLTTDYYRSKEIALPKRAEDLDEESPYALMLRHMRTSQKLHLLLRACNKSWDGNNNTLGYRFIGHDVKEMCHVFPAMIDAVFPACVDQKQKHACLKFLITSTYLRDVLKLACSFYITDQEIARLEILCTLYYQAAVLLHGLKFPSAWTLRYVVPFHVKRLRELYGVVREGMFWNLGAVSTEAGEGKHVPVKQYASKTSPQNMWTQILRYDAAARLELVAEDPSLCPRYSPIVPSYVPDGVTDGTLCHCGLPPSEGPSCHLCCRQEIKDMKDAVAAGSVSQELREILFSYLNSGDGFCA